nr:hypothetical protein [Nocardia mangyaensis]
MEPRPIEQRDRLVVADRGDVECLLEQRRLVAEVEVTVCTATPARSAIWSSVVAP